MKLVNWDGTGGVFAPTGGIQKITHRATVQKDKEHNRGFPEPANQMSGQPERFVHLLSIRNRIDAYGCWSLRHSVMVRARTSAGALLIP